LDGPSAGQVTRVSRTSTRIDATPERIFEVLDDARTYEFWVVGCTDIRGVDPEWPAEGAAFHHSVGVGPLHLKDSTSILERDPPRRLKLHARARPAGIAHVLIELTRSGSSTDVAMSEKPVEGLPAKLHNPLQDHLIHRRNVESLRRLKWLAERG
jgi:uncharacterized protein YndB with AHSA1/START domain